MKKLIISTLAVLALTATANATDLPNKKKAPEAPKEPEPQPEQKPTLHTLNDSFKASMESAGVTLDDIKDVAAMRPQLAPRSMEWNDWTDISDDDCKFIIENVSVENGTIKWKKR